MNLILVSLDNFQEYILDNIQHLLRLRVSNIYVITNIQFFTKFEKFNSIKLINVDDLHDSYNYCNITNLDKNFRNGFWTLTSLRFFYVYALIKKFDLIDCVHIENDVLLYYNIDILRDKINDNFIYVPFDTFNRNIASIMYIPNSHLFKKILDNYDNTKNDMDNFKKIKLDTGLIHNLPIFPNIFAISNEEKFVSENFETFNFIFDAAAIGQFLGGVDPRNIPGDTTGFVNETCVIKYNNYRFFWKKDNNNIKKPYIIINDINYPIFNLHIHSKNLAKFM